MTTLYVPRTPVVCEKCQEEFVFPAHLLCPRCACPIEFEVDPLHSGMAYAPQGTIGSAPQASTARESQQAHHGFELDRGSKRMVYFGLILSGGLFAAAVWTPSFIHLLLQRAEIDGTLPFMVVRFVLILLTLWAFLEGVISILTWSSGYHWYRRFRFPG